MDVTSMPGNARSDWSKAKGLLLLIPAVSYDLLYLVLRMVLQYLAPAVSMLIAAALLFGVWLNLERDSSASSNTVTAMLVTLSALGFTWASAIDRENRNYPAIMAMSKQLMHSGIALILATGAKFALMNFPPVGSLPLDGKTLRFILWLVMSSLFIQALLEAALPILQFNSLLSRELSYLPGLSLLRKHLPEPHARATVWLRRSGSGRDPTTPATGV